MARVFASRARAVSGLEETIEWAARKISLPHTGSIAIHLSWTSVIPEIVAEVRPPTETLGMFLQKLSRYLEAGVKELWYIYPEPRIVEVWTSTSEADRDFSGNDTLVSPLLPGFELPLQELFA